MDPSQDFQNSSPQPSSNSNPWLTNLAAGKDQYGNAADPGAIAWAKSQLGVSGSGLPPSVSTPQTGGASATGVSSIPSGNAATSVSAPKAGPGGTITNISSKMPAGYQPPQPTTQPTAQTGAFNPDASVHVSLNGQDVGDQKVMNGRTYEPLQDIARFLGKDYSTDPKTGMVTIGGKQFLSPYTDKQGNKMLGLRDVAEAFGYNVGWDGKNNQVSITEPQQQGTGLSGMPQMPQLQPYQQPDMSAYQNNMMPYGTFNNDMSSYYTQAHNQLDPTFNANYNQLMTKQTNDLTKLDEGLNAKGIYSSGIAVAAENDLRAKTTDSVANMFSKQMGQIEKTAQTLYDTAYKQFQQGNQFALKNNEYYTTQMMNEQKQSFTQWLSTQKLTLQQYQDSVNAFDKMATLIQNNTKMMLPYQYQTANNAATNQTSMDKALLPYDSMTKYQQGELGIKQEAQDLMAHFKQLGYNLDVAKAEEIVRHNHATEASAADGNMLKLDQMMGNVNGHPTLDAQKFAQQTYYQNQLLNEATASATDNATKFALDDYKTQLTNITQDISSYTTPGTANYGKQIPGTATASYNALMQKINALVPQQNFGGSDPTLNNAGDNLTQ